MSGYTHANIAHFYLSQYYIFLKEYLIILCEKILANHFHSVKLKFLHHKVLYPLWVLRNNFLKMFSQQVTLSLFKVLQESCVWSHLVLLCYGVMSWQHLPLGLRGWRMARRYPKLITITSWSHYIIRPMISLYRYCWYTIPRQLTLDGTLVWLPVQLWAVGYTLMLQCHIVVCCHYPPSCVFVMCFCIHIVIVVSRA